MQGQCHEADPLRGPESSRSRALPDDAGLAAALGQARRARNTSSSVEPYRAIVEHWFDAGVQGKAIHAALCREHGYRGSYSAVAQLVARLRTQRAPAVTVRLSFAPGEAAQVDFGAGQVRGYNPARST